MTCIAQLVLCWSLLDGPFWGLKILLMRYHFLLPYGFQNTDHIIPDYLLTSNSLASHFICKSFANLRAAKMLSRDQNLKPTVREVGWKKPLSTGVCMRWIVRVWAMLKTFKPNCHLSRKSQTIGDFTVSRLSQISPRYRKIVRPR